MHLHSVDVNQSVYLAFVKDGLLDVEVRVQGFDATDVLFEVCKLDAFFAEDLPWIGSLDLLYLRLGES